MKVKYLLNIALGTIFLVSAFCMSAIYGTGLPGLAILMAFTFLGILIVIAANNSKLTGITQIGNIKPLEITRTQNKLADRALAKMKNAYSLKLYQ